MTKFLVHNVHSISIEEKLITLQCLITTEKDNLYDVLMLCESGAISYNQDCGDSIRQSLRTVWNFSIFRLSSVPDNGQQYAQPGRTMIIINNNTSGRIDEHGTDKFGRWSWITLHGRHRQKIMIITVYMV